MTMAAPINPKMQPDAPRLIEFNGSKINEKRFPINPEVIYSPIKAILEKCDSLKVPKINKANMLEKRCKTSPCRNIAESRRQYS